MPVPAPETDAPPRRLLREEAYERIRDAILDGTLAPGERIRDQDLTAWLQLSRTPVREALARLEEDGLVETAPQRFTRVTPLDRDEARDAFELVAALHAMAAESATPRLTAAQINQARDANAAFAAALDADDVEAALAADDAFHDVFVVASGNSELPRVLARLMPRLRRLERLQFSSLHGRRSVRQHEHILTLARRADPEGAAAATRENWRSLAALIDSSLPPTQDRTSP